MKAPTRRNLRGFYFVGALKNEIARKLPLEPSGRATTIKVQNLLPQRRKLRGEDGRYIQVLGIEAVTLLTDEGKVEVAARPESLDKLSEVLGGR